MESFAQRALQASQRRVLEVKKPWKRAVATERGTCVSDALLPTITFIRSSIFHCGPRPNSFRHSRHPFGFRLRAPMLPTPESTDTLTRGHGEPVLGVGGATKRGGAGQCHMVARTPHTSSKKRKVDLTIWFSRSSARSPTTVGSVRPVDSAGIQKASSIG